jgi:hypothetical protein
MADTTYTNVVGFAPEVAPAYQRLIGKAEALTDSPYQTYNRDRIAQFTPLQKQSYEGAAKLGPSTASLKAATGLEKYAKEAADIDYRASNFKNQFQPQNFGYNAQDAKAAQLGLAPTMTAAQMGPYERVRAQQIQAQNINAAQMSPAQQIQARNINAARMGPFERVGTQSFVQPGVAGAYMSPYMQNVVDIQNREAQRQSGIQGTQQQAQATQAGAFGGSRDAIMRAERERNLAQQMGDIQAQGSQAAYAQAQQQFNAEQGYGLTAQQSNQQAGLTTGSQNLNAQQQAAVQNAANQLQASQANQQTGLTVGIQNLNAQQQANVQNVANQLQASGMNAQQAMQAALANQQAGLTTNIENLRAQQQAAAANQAMQGQYGLQQGQFTQQTNLANQGAQNQAKQFSAGQKLQSAGMGAQYGQAANQLNEQSRQYGAGLGLQGLQAGMQGMSNLGAVGQNIYGQQANALGIQNAFGGQQQQQGQNVLNQQYQDFLNQENAPYKNLNFMSDILNRAPTSNLGQSMYQAPPSMLNQVAGAGTAAAGLFGAYNQYNQPNKNAKGGAIKSKKPAGLQALLLNSMA